MKKSVALVALAFGVTSAFAQDLTSKKGEPFLPEAGDWAIGIEATPFFSYAKSLIGAGNGATSPSWNFLNGNNMIIGKYFTDAQTAYRAGINLGFMNQSRTDMIGQAGASAPTFPAAPAMVEDKLSVGNTMIGLSVGLEKRRGKTRLQGFYGADVLLTLSSAKEKYTYGNALSSTVGVTGNTTDFTTDPNNTGITGDNLTTPSPYGGRVTERKSGMTFNFGVRGFIGAEYFLFPKISIGGEFGWGIGFAMQGKSKVTSENVNGGSVGSTEIEGGKSSKFMVGTDRNAFGTAANQFGPTGTLRLNLHF